MGNAKRAPYPPTLAPVVIDLEALSIYIAQLVAAQIAELLPATSPWMDVAHTADYLCCSPERVRKLVERQAIPFHQDRPRGRLFFSRKELDEWLLSL
jgi:excisionase family DNA binding protein